MINKKTLQTSIIKFSLLLVNFLLIVFTSRIWGSEGRGEIALIMTNILLIGIVNNIFTGSTVSFHASKTNKKELLKTAVIGSFITTTICTIIACIIYGFDDFEKIFTIALLTSICNSIAHYYIGVKNITWFNILIAIPLFSLFLLVLFFYYILNIKSLEIYFYSFYIALFITLIISLFKFFRNDSIITLKIQKENVKKIIRYGFNNEINSFFQFLNYRISYFFIAYNIGKEQLGVFSVAIAMAEAMWIISKSKSVVHYSEVVNTTNKKRNLLSTLKLAKQSLILTVILSTVFLVTPNSIFTFIFGENFTDVKTYTTYLIPGILIIAVSNLHGHYFSGTGDLYTLKMKSFIGFIATSILCVLLIPRYGLYGACISINVSYFASSIYLFYRFKKARRVS